MKKQDGRKNNGGRRPGAGRPRSEAKALADTIDSHFAELALNQEIWGRNKVGNQVRRSKRTRFDVILDFYAKNELIFTKNYRRDFEALIDLAFETSETQEIYEYRKSRMEFVVHRAEEGLEKTKQEKDKKIKPKEPWQIEQEKAARRAEAYRETIRQQEHQNAKAIDSYLRNKEIDEEHWGPRHRNDS